jgi:hypothetical protein
MVLDNVSVSAFGTERSATTGYLILGDYSGAGSNNLEGGIRDIVIYNRALNSSQIEEIVLANGSMNLDIDENLVNGLLNPTRNLDYIFPFSGVASMVICLVVLGGFLFFS